MFFRGCSLNVFTKTQYLEIVVLIDKYESSSWASSGQDLFFYTRCYENKLYHLQGPPRNFSSIFYWKAPWQICIICDHNFIEVGLAYWTLLIFQNKSQSQRTSVTNISVITNTKGEILEWVETKNAVIMILDINSWGADVAFFAGTSCLLHLFIIKFTNTIQIIRFKDSNSN